jgi:integrase
MPISRKRKNNALPKYWRLTKNTYYYRVPQHLRHLHEGKAEISLGQSLIGAYKKFADLYETDECISLMRELFNRYIMEVVPEHDSMNTRKSKLASLDKLLHSFGHNLVSQMTPQVIYGYRDHIRKTRSKKQANLHLEVLSHCFTKAIEWGIISDHPMTNKKVVKFSLEGRDRYVENWELQEWAKVANPFLVVYIVLKGVTGLRQQDLLTIKRTDILDTELEVFSLKVKKKLRFPLQNSDGTPTTVQLALDAVKVYYKSVNAGKKYPMVSPYLFHTRKGTSYYNMEKSTASSFASVWQRSMKKALKITNLIESFTEHDLRAKASSDLDSTIDAQKLLAHANASTTEKHYRRKGTLIKPASGFDLG